MTVQETDRYRGEVTIERPNAAFSKGLIGRMNATFNAADLTIVGGRYDGKKTAAHHFMPALMAAENGTPANTDKFNGSLPFVSGVLLGVDASPMRYVDGIGGSDLANFPQIAIDIANGADQTGTVMRILYGATEQMPARALSYPLPALNMMQELYADKHKGVEPPQLQLVFATHTSAVRNAKDVTSARNEALLLAGRTREYVETFFPDIAQKVVFLEDNPSPSSAREIERLSQMLRTSGDRDMLEGLRQRGDVFDLVTSTQYGAAHLLFHDMDAPELLKPIFEDQPPMIHPQSIINLGGRQEQFFYKIHHVLRDRLEDGRLIPTVQLVTQHHVPPYSMANGGDVPLEGMRHPLDFDVKSATNAAARDLRYLENVTSFRKNAMHGGTTQ